MFEIENNIVFGDVGEEVVEGVCERLLETVY